MSKPVLVFKFNDTIRLNTDRDMYTTYNNFQEFLDKKFHGTDYIILVLPEKLEQNFDIQVFRTEEAQLLDIEELKKQIQEHFKLTEAKA